ncbi:MAG TPA: hypothetical protein VL588_10730 [Bdellovibrionota bacterium]|jgi:hypothetical protein|nr:hypothetical protein [Bdellovibrionota bacterium]
MKNLKNGMKKALMIVSLVGGGLGALPATAHAYYVQPMVMVTPGEVEAQVSNETYLTLNCSVRVVGITASGQWITSWANLVVPPGGFEYAYVYSTYEPFMNGQATAQCQTVGGYGF